MCEKVILGKGFLSILAKLFCQKIVLGLCQRGKEESKSYQICNGYLYCTYIQCGFIMRKLAFAPNVIFILGSEQKKVWSYNFLVQYLRKFFLLGLCELPFSTTIIYICKTHTLTRTCNITLSRSFFFEKFISFSTLRPSFLFFCNKMCLNSETFFVSHLETYFSWVFPLFFSFLFENEWRTLSKTDKILLNIAELTGSKKNID